MPETQHNSLFLALHALSKGAAGHDQQLEIVKYFRDEAMTGELTDDLPHKVHQKVGRRDAFADMLVSIDYVEKQAND